LTAYATGGPGTGMNRMMGMDRLGFLLVPALHE
jgi:hypothetical protein